MNQARETVPESLLRRLVRKPHEEKVWPSSSSLPAREEAGVLRGDPTPTCWTRANNMEKRI